MSDITNLLYTHNHEWVKIKKGKTIVVGITDYAQSILSEVTHVDLPEPDEQVYDAGEEIGVIESLRSSLPYHCPVSGAITAANTELLSSPELINDDPFGDGWIFEMTVADMSEISDLLSLDEYESHFPDEEDE